MGPSRKLEGGEYKYNADNADNAYTTRGFLSRGQMMSDNLTEYGYMIYNKPDTFFMFEVNSYLKYPPSV